MNKEYEVRWSNIAENDLIKIIEYIAEHNPAIPSKYFESSNRRRQAFTGFQKEAALSRNYGIKEYCNIGK